ncbi:hypothetical protein ACQY1Q_08310 [Tenacibaculum sp. TC6]|uniref:hypothetical protein n=1 Tax=Tenacibaculum sp. TC6 TaxID=3423223 RepID=UPI003D366FC6
MKKLFALCVLVMSNFVFAQSPTQLKVTESNVFKDYLTSYNIITMYSAAEGKTVIARSGKKKFLFDVFDADFNKTFSQDIKVSRKEIFVGELFYNNKLKLFTVFAPKKDERIVYCHTVDLTTNSYNKTTIFETTVEKKQDLFGSRKNHNTSFALSPNNEYLAIATDNITKNKNSYTIRVFSAKTNELIYKHSYQESEERSFEHNDLYIDNSANVYSLGKLFIKGNFNKNTKGEANYQFVLNKISKEKNTELALNLEKEEHIQSLRIVPLDNQLQLIGFYSELNVDRVKGSCSFLIDTQNFNLKTKHKQSLTKQVYEDLYGYRTGDRKSKKKKELRNFEIDHVLTDNNGNTYIIAEEFYITSTYVNNGNMGGYWTTTYHYDDILILKNTPDGKLAWGRSIFKRATSPSYNAFLKDDQLHIILNSGKNLTKKNDGRIKVSRGWFESTSLYDIEYSSNGDVSYNKIQDNKNKEFYFPFFGTYDGNKFIMMSSNKSKKRFMILE